MANPSFSAPRYRPRLAIAVLLAGLLGLSVGCVTISQSELEMRPRIGPPRTRVTTPSVPSGARIEVRCDFERLRTMQVYGGGGSLIRVRCPREDLERYFAASGFAAGRVVLSSGGLEPVADSGGGRGHSVFASAFLDALRSNSSIVDGGPRSSLS